MNFTTLPHTKGSNIDKVENKYPAAFTESFLIVGRELQEVEQTLERTLVSSAPLLSDASLHLIGGGGKRLRPALFLLSAKLGQYDPARLIPLAAAIEILHLATLVHDDVIDKASTRRNRPSVNHRWGNNVAVLLGDYYYGKFLSLVFAYGTTVLTRLATVISDLVEGEFCEQAACGKLDLSEKEYFYRIKKKTASFIATCCYLGAEVSNAPQILQIKMEHYGYYLGLAFQIQDDLLDLLGNKDNIGKPVGHDYSQGIFTLPLIHGLNSAHCLEIRHLLADKTTDPEKRNQLCALLQESGSIRYTQKIISAYMQAGMKTLASLPPGPTKTSLQDLTNFVFLRRH